jgi:PAS domain S-box-containing protein
MVNPVLARINGLRVEAHLGRTPMEVLPELPAAFVAEQSRRVLETGQPQREVALEAATPATGGAKRHYREQWYPVRVSGEVVGIGVIVEDVTDRMRAEAARDRVVGVVSHDLRSPLSAILMACSLLLGRELRPEIARTIARIQRSATHMRAVVEQLFDYARLDRSGNLPLARTWIDLGEVARRVIEEAELASSRTDTRVALEVHGDVRGQWDEARVAQVVSNLAGNALQHGERNVLVRVTGREDEVRIDVANEGSPIPEDLRPRLFEPFESGASDGSHLGLGLYIAREIVRAHGGSIEVQSNGTTVFAVRLPRR